MPRDAQILALAGDPEVEARLRQELPAAGRIVFAADETDALERFRREPERIDLVVLREGATRSRWQALADRLAGVRPGLPIVLLAARPEGEAITAAVRSRRITSTLRDPWRPGELEAACEQAAELGALRRELEGERRQAARRLEALAALNEIAAAATDLTTYEEVVDVVTRELHRIVPNDVAAAMLAFEDRSPVMHLHCREACDESLLRATRDRCLEAYRSWTGGAVDEDGLTVNVSGSPPADDGLVSHPGSTLLLPISVDDAVIGVVFVAARWERAFSENDEQMLGFLAHRTGDAVRRLAARFHDERRRLSLMVESMADGLILTDLKSDDVLINPAARRMLGIDPVQPVNQQFLKDALGFYPFDLIATGAESQIPLREEVKVGDKVLHSMISAVRDASGKIVGVVVVLRDFTEAAELSRRQQEFVSVVSHELRTPLTSITGALDIALSERAGALGDKRRQYLKMARDSCSKLGDIVDDLLDVARSEHGRMPVHFTPILLDELGRDIVERYRPAAQAKNIRLHVKTEARGIRIAGDPDRLTQVLNNLLSNAIKFTPAHGSIEVEIFGPSVAASHLGVSVFNNGEPIPPDARERIFEKFERMQLSSTRKVGGTGLGLAISRAIVEAHGGRIWVESRSDGTKFVFTLPAAPEEAAEPGEGPAREVDLGEVPPAHPGGVVLLADDDLHSTYILKGILMAAGHEVLVTRDADGALSTARNRRPALIVVNSDLCGGEGLPLVEILKHDPDTHKASIIVVSDRAQREDAARVGADEYMAKPIDPGRFRELCNRLITEAGRARANRILVVDDDPTIRTICREVLDGAGYAVREASDGLTALAEARRFKPDLLLLDVMMPDLDGFQTAERFRSDSATSMTPIIFLSAKGETADKVRAFRIGAEDYVVKPFVAAELVARVHKALERRDRELGASPTTQLPGAGAIEAEIERRLLAPDDTAFCYLDLDHLKAFNDHYGYARADGIIRQTGDLVRDVIRREGNPGDFIGHIAGDDFVFITTADVVDAICSTICTAFDRLVPLYYNKIDRERGHIEIEDRYGVLRKFPIMGVSLATVTQAGGRIDSYAQLSEAAAAGKKLAKTIAGSSYVRDGRILLGDPERAGTEGTEVA